MYLGRGMCACEIGRRERYDAGRDRVSMTVGVTESTVEAAALEWLGSLGWKVIHSLDIAPECGGCKANGVRRSQPGAAGCSPPWIG